MHQVNVQSFKVLDALGMIASCSGSSEVIELVTALQAIETGGLWVPVGPAGEAMTRRISQLMGNSQWVESARKSLNSAETHFIVLQLFQWCLWCVPTNSSDPFADETWLPRVRLLYSWDPNLQRLAESIVNQFALPKDIEIAAQAPVMPAQPIAPTAPAPAVAKMAISQDANQAQLIARLRRIAKVKRFLELFTRYWNAQKARAAVPKPTSEQIAAPATPIQPVPIPAPTPEPICFEAPIEDQPTRTRKPMRFANRRATQPWMSIPASLLSTNAAIPEPRVTDSPNSFVEVKPYPGGLSPPI